MKTEKIESEISYLKKLERINELFECIPGTPEAKEFETLVRQVEEYEAKHYPVDQP